MKILLIGSGGRERALEWMLRKSVFVTDIISVPGDLGRAECAWCGSDMFTGIGRFSQYLGRKDIDFVIVGPEVPLVAGIADMFRLNGKPVFGPSKRAAELEGSKVACKLFCKAYDIPTADFDIAETPEQAKRIVQKRGTPIVVKADGPADGKGVKVAWTREEAYTAIEDFSTAPAGRRFIIEEPLVGSECSYIVLTDGTHVVPLPPTRDYKAAHAGSVINTGGMGCITLSRDEFTPALERQVQETIIEPALAALRDEGRPFTGALYTGLMIVNGRPYVLEFNCRLGDPETQTSLPLMCEGMDFFPLLHATTNGTMRYRVSPWKYQHAVCIVLAAEGYPGKPRTGDIIRGIEEVEQMEGVHIFHAGTQRQLDGTYVTTAGRVLNLVGTKKTIKAARQQVYEAVHRIHFDGVWYREDIGL